VARAFNGLPQSRSCVPSHIAELFNRRFALKLLSIVAALNVVAAEEPVVWHLDKPESVGDFPSTVFGRLASTREGMVFDGAHDGILVPTNPIAGWTAFTVEILFSPADGGRAEQRFLHLEDANGSRALVELRSDPSGQWWLDTFLRDDDSQLTLIDSHKKHATGKWFWAALRYDGTTMTHFVDGEKECEGLVKFRPMSDGRVSIGVRQNKVFWFKGAIREVRFTPAALPVDQLQRSH